MAPQTVMLGGIPPSIHHGGAQEVAGHGMLVSSLRLISYGFNQLYDKCSHFTSVVEIFSRGNNFNPASTCCSTHFKLRYLYTPKAVVPLHI